MNRVSGSETQKIYADGFAVCVGRKVDGGRERERGERTRSKKGRRDDRLGLPWARR
jgi:hypothetical protein